MKTKASILLLSFFILITFLLSGCELSDILGSSQISNNSDAPLTISFIDVGQGDSTLIECENEAMLINAGLYGNREKVINYLSSRNIKNLRYCVATHPHSDHIGGMDAVIYTFDVDTLVYPEVKTESASWNYLLDACDERGVSYYNPEVSDTFTLGGAELTVLSPAKGAEYENTNNTSLVLKLTYGDVSFMFTGDAEKEVERELLESSFDLRADVLKCGHHGSSTSTTKEFLEAVNPFSAVISCGKGNDYGHPHSETVTNLKNQNVQIYRTDKSSTIVAQSDGKEISFFSASGSEITRSKTETTLFEYIGNTSSYVFHRSDCASVKDMKEKNKMYFITKTEAVLMGYTPCGACKP